MYLIPVSLKTNKQNKPPKKPKPKPTTKTLQGDWKTISNQISEDLRNTRKPERQK